MVAASILSVVEVTNLIGRLSMGFISDRVGGRTALVACATTLALALIWLLFAKEVWMFYVFALFFGLAAGSMVPLETVVTSDLFGIMSVGAILGSLRTFGTSGGALGAPLAGTIFDTTGSYNLAFLICVMLGVLAIILSLILLKAKGWHGNSTNTVS